VRRKSIKKIRTAYGWTQCTTLHNPKVEKNEYVGPTQTRKEKREKKSFGKKKRPNRPQVLEPLKEGGRKLRKKNVLVKEGTKGEEGRGQ